MQLGVGGERATVQPFALQAVEEALHMRVVGGLAWPIHALSDTQGRELSAKLVGSVLHPAIAVEDEARLGLSIGHSAMERAQAQSRRLVASQAPADDAPGVTGHHHGDVAPPLEDSAIADAGHPKRSGAAYR